MDFHKVESSNVDEVGYEPLTQELQVRYKNGGLYAYDGVPDEVVQQLMAAESVGKFLNAEIKPKYPFRKLS